MTIVPIGDLLLQVSSSEHPEFEPELCTAIQGQVLRVVGRCLEEALETELERQPGRGRYRRRRQSKGQEIERRCSRCGSLRATIVAVINGKSFAGMVIIHVVWTLTGGG